MARGFKESETIEFKKSTAEVKVAVVSIAAMLNKNGRGEVYFGIDDNGKILGQTIGRTTLKDVTQAVVDNTEPKIYPKVEVRQIEKKRLHCCGGSRHRRPGDGPVAISKRWNRRMVEGSDEKTEKRITVCYEEFY